MQRRVFMTQSLAASALVLTGAPDVPVPRQTWFELRRYTLAPGPQAAALTDAYLAHALIPALNRLGISPVGAFKLDIGPETPAAYLLIPSTSLETLANLTTLLAADQSYAKAAEPFLAAPVDHAPIHRIDSTLLADFHGFNYPAAAPGAPKRIFQLRIYESPTPHAHQRKVEMFQQGEIDIFLSVSFRPVFFGRALIGANLPSLTYMLTFNDQDELAAKWSAFSGSPAWHKLIATPGLGDDSLIRAITNLILSPKPYSQI